MRTNKEALTILGIWLSCMLCVTTVVMVSYYLIGPLTFSWLLPISFYGLWYQIKTGKI